MSGASQSVRTAIQKGLEHVVGRVYLSANQTALNGNAWNKINLNTAQYDLGANFDLALHKFTVPVTGLYHVEGCFVTTDASTIATKRYLVAIYKNGAEIIHGGACSVIASGVFAVVMDELFLQKDDWLELYVYPEVGGGTNTVAAQSLFDGTHLVVRLITKEGIRQ